MIVIHPFNGTPAGDDRRVGVHAHVDERGQERLVAGELRARGARAAKTACLGRCEIVRKS